MSLEGDAGALAQHIWTSCTANGLRTLNRALTAIYDDALRPVGGSVSQLNIVVALLAGGPATPSELSRTLGIEKSTLSRTLDRMRTRGWLEFRPCDDARSHRLQVTEAGADLLATAYPAWQKAQRKVRTLLGEEGISALKRMMLSVQPSDLDRH